MLHVGFDTHHPPQRRLLRPSVGSGTLWPVLDRWGGCLDTMDYNEGLRALAPARRAAAARAKQAREAAMQLAEINLEREVGPAKAAFESETARMVEEFKRQRRDYFEAQLRAQHGGALAAYEAELARIEQQFAADMAAADAPVNAFRAAYAAEKKKRAKEAADARWWASPAGQQALADKAKSDRWDREELAFAITTGWPPMWWMRWQHELGLSMGGVDGPNSRWAQAEPLRAEYLKHYPEQRAMIESPTPDLYHAWVAERGGENERPAMPAVPA